MIDKDPRRRRGCANRLECILLRHLVVEVPRGAMVGEHANPAHLDGLQDAPREPQVGNTFVIDLPEQRRAYVERVEQPGRIAIDGLTLDTKGIGGLLPTWRKRLAVVNRYLDVAHARTPDDGRREATRTCDLSRMVISSLLGVIDRCGAGPTIPSPGEFTGPTRPAAIAALTWRRAWRASARLVSVAPHACRYCQLGAT